MGESPIHKNFSEPDIKINNKLLKHQYEVKNSKHDLDDGNKLTI